MNKFLKQGEHDISDDLYFADPCPNPSLSATMAKDLINATPLHAWTNSKRLNPFHEDKNSATFDIGSAFHTMVLSRGAKIHVIEAKDWRTKDAKEQRDAAYAAGCTPVLVGQLESLENMQMAAELQLAAHSCGNPFTGKDAEKTLIWYQGGVWNRIKVDQIDRENRVLYDLKTCETAEPGAWLHTNMRMGIDIRVAHYLEGAEAVFGGDWCYRIVPVEKKPPHGLSVIELHPDAIAIGRKKTKRARDILSLCLKRDKWTGYAREIYRAEPKEFFANEWLEREWMEADYKRATGRDVIEESFAISGAVAS